MPVVPTPEDLRRKGEGSFRRGWRDGWAIIGSAQFQLGALVLSALAALVSFAYLSDTHHSITTRSVVAALVVIVGWVFLASLLLALLIVLAPYRQRDDARHARDLLEQSSAPQQHLTYPDLQARVRELIDTGKRLIARLPDDLARDQLYMTYDEVAAWYREIDAALRRTYLDWHARVLEGRFIRNVSELNSTGLRRWIEETIRRLKELIENSDGSHDAVPAE